MPKNIRVWFYGRENKDLKGNDGIPYAYYYGLITEMESEPLCCMIMNDETGEIIFERGNNEG